MIILNKHQQSLSKLIVIIIALQLAIILFALILMQALGPMTQQDWSSLSSILVGCIIYNIAYGTYGLVYFSPRGGRYPSKVVVAMIYGIVLKYTLLIGLSTVAIAYLSIELPHFFISLLVNHLVYVIVITRFHT